MGCALASSADGLARRSSPTKGLLQPANSAGMVQTVVNLLRKHCATQHHSSNEVSAISRMSSTCPDIDLHGSPRSEIITLESLRLPLGVDQLSLWIKLQERPRFVLLAQNRAAVGQHHMFRLTVFVEFKSRTRFDRDAIDVPVLLEHNAAEVPFHKVQQFRGEISDP